MPNTASLTPIQPEVGMSARQVFQHALMHTQLTRHPDDEPFFLSHTQLQELPPDCRDLVTTLGYYGMEDGVGLNIYRNHPQLVAKINPNLKAGVKVYLESNLQKAWTWDQVEDFAIGLAQAALDGVEEFVFELPALDELEESNSQPATSRAENKKAPPTTVPTNTIQ